MSETNEQINTPLHNITIYSSQLESTGTLYALVGGPNNNSFIFYIQSYYKASHHLKLYYFSTAQSAVRVSINDNPGELHILPSTCVKSNENKFFEFTIDLDIGISKIKIYSVDPENTLISITSQVIGPPIAKPYMPTKNYYNIASGTLANDASIDFYTSFVTNLGGTRDGSSQITINTPSSGIYNLTLRYLSPKDNSNLKVDIMDNENTNNFIFSKIFNMTKTDGSTYWDAKVLLLQIDLPKGKNLLIFHGDGSNPAPDLGVLNILPFNKYYATNGDFSNNAKINEDLNTAGYLGGQNDGSCVISVNVPFSTMYNITIDYICGETRPIVIDINNISTTYSFPSTGGWTLDKSGLFIIQVILKQGINLIKFHGNGSNYAPDIYAITILPYNEYSSTLGYFVNGTSIDIRTNFVRNIGGPNNGIITVPVLTKNAGTYNLALKYLSNNITSTLKMYVNSESYGPYILPGTSTLDHKDFKVFTTQINLKQGSNLIQFYGNTDTIGLYLGNFKLMSFNTYDVSYGELSNRCIKDISTDFAKDLGGFSDGTSKVTVIVPTTNLYYLSIQYLSPYANNLLKVDINEFNGLIYTLPSTSGLSVSDSRTFTITIPLNAGTNSIKFHGNGSNFAPYLSTLTLMPNLSTIPTQTIPNNTIPNTSTTPNCPQCEQCPTIPQCPTLPNCPQCPPLPSCPQCPQCPPCSNSTTISANNTFASNNIKNNILNNIFINSTSTCNSSSLLALFNLENATLTNGAVSNQTINFVENVGGTKDGTITFQVYVNTTGIFNLFIQYLSTGTSRPFKIDVLNFSSTTYTVPQTIDRTPENSKLFSLSLNLTKGNNTIIIHGDGINNAPDFSLVILSSCSSEDSSSITPTPNISQPTSINILAKDGILSGGAKKDTSNNFLTWLGGPNDGTTIITPTIPVNGLYRLSIKYVCNEINRPLRIDLPSVKSFTILNLPLTSSWNISDALTFTIPIQLNAGIPEIKLHGNGSNFSPDLENISLSFISSVVSNIICPTTIPVYCPTCPTCPTTPSMTIPTTSFIKINTSNKGTGINQFNFNSTWNDGVNEVWTQSVNSTFAINFNGIEISLIGIKDPRHGIYQISIDNNVPIEVNSYSATRTQTQTIYNSGILSNGNHTLQFKIKSADAQINYAIVTSLNETSTLPSITSPTTPLLSYNINKTFNGTTDYLDLINDLANVKSLTEGAIVIKFKTTSTIPNKVLFSVSDNTSTNTSLSLLFGTTSKNLSYEVTQNGLLLTSCTTSVVVNDGNIHTSLINVGSTGTSIYLDGINVFLLPSSKIFFSNISNATSMNIGRTLDNTISGKNYFNGTIEYIDIYSKELLVNQCILYSLNAYKTATILPNNTYNLLDSTLSGGATIDSRNNFTGSIGGTNNGTASLIINSLTTSLYKLSIQYLSGDIYVTRPLKIDITLANSTTLVSPSPTLDWTLTNAKSFSLPILLNTGANLIKFHGNGTNYAPSIGLVTLTLTNAISTLSTPTVPIFYNFNPINGSFSNGAIPDNTLNIAGWIGGPLDGSVTLTATVPYSGVYNLTFKYISGEIRPLKIDTKSSFIYNLPITNDWLPKNAKTFTLPVIFRNGTNEIKFQGNGINQCPSIGLISIQSITTPNLSF